MSNATGVVKAVASGPFAPYLEDKEVGRTHVLINVSPQSVVDMCREGMEKGIFQVPVHALRPGCYWFTEHDFAVSTASAGFHLIRHSSMERSEELSWQEQLQLVHTASDEQIPSAQTLLFLIIHYFQTEGSWLFHNQRIHTSSVDRDGRQIYIHCRGNWLNICGYLPQHSNPASLPIALVLEKKPV